MRFLECLLCVGELDIITNLDGIKKVIKCRECGYINNNNSFNNKKEPEITIIRKKISE